MSYTRHRRESLNRHQTTLHDAEAKCSECEAARAPERSRWRRRCGGNAQAAGAAVLTRLPRLHDWPRCAGRVKPALGTPFQGSPSTADTSRQQPVLHAAVPLPQHYCQSAPMLPWGQPKSSPEPDGPTAPSTSHLCGAAPRSRLETLQQRRWLRLRCLRSAVTDSVG